MKRKMNDPPNRQVILACYENALEYLRKAHEEISVLQTELLARRQFPDAGDAGHIAAQIKEIITTDHGEAGLAMIVDYWRGAPR